jgi:anti-anti-sigma factor
MSSLPATTLEVHELDGGCGLRLIGELDLATASALRDALADIDASDEVVLELDELAFIDSSGCHALTSYLRGEPDARTMVFVDPSPAVARTLELTGLTKHPRIEIRSSSG